MHVQSRVESSIASVIDLKLKINRYLASDEWLPIKSHNKGSSKPKLLIETASCQPVSCL